MDKVVKIRNEKEILTFGPVCIIPECQSHRRTACKRW